MIEDLKIIKKKYGEEMMHFCRDNFSTLLEKEGLLSRLLLDHFAPSHELYSDLVKFYKLDDFKDYIYSFVSNKKTICKTDKTPEELLEEVGYILYECKTEKDIQKFKKYYVNGEELCTFSGGRLNSCYVFFAVKKNVDEIKREDFKKPNRQDAYGTSVISIQFTKGDSHTLSIKNRYNHTVENPDATFSNNLDNIIQGLTYSFEKYYGIVQKNKNNSFILPKYVLASDGKYYKYNYEINNIYYCPNNIIIDEFEVKQYEKEKYIVMDNFILDLQNKRIYLFDQRLNDSFVDSLQDIQDLRIEKKENGKTIFVIPNIGKAIEIGLDKENNIISYKNNNLTEIEDFFLYSNEKVLNIELNNVEKIGNSFLEGNRCMEELSLPNVKYIENNFLFYNRVLSKIDIPNVISIDSSFLCSNKKLQKISLPNVVSVGNQFINWNSILNFIDVPKLESISDDFLANNDSLECLYLPNVTYIGVCFMFYNNSLKEFYAPKLEVMHYNGLFNNRKLKKYDLSSLRIADICFEEHPFISAKRIIKKNNKKR